MLLSDLSNQQPACLDAIPFPRWHDRCSAMVVDVKHCPREHAKQRNQC